MAVKRGRLPIVAFFCPFGREGREPVLAQGEVHIYGPREDGVFFSVYQDGQGILLGDIEFIRSQTPPFY